MDKNNVLYRVTRVANKDGSEKYPYEQQLPDNLFIKFLQRDKSAVFYDLKNSRTIKTSKVEDFYIWENGFMIVTLNSIYYINSYVG